VIEFLLAALQKSQHVELIRVVLKFFARSVFVPAAHRVPGLNIMLAVGK
jgi:hypothetical protein